MRRLFPVLLGSLFVPLLTFPIFAHVTVKPEKAGVGEFEIFSVQVPNEEEIPTVGVRLVLPEGLGHITPNVKPGWTINFQKNESGEVTEIAWTEGSIPTGQRDEFVFSAQTPAEPTDLAWKAYQTYSDGRVVAWDGEPSEQESSQDFSERGPYSMTEVINEDEALIRSISQDNTVFYISLIALVLSIASLGLYLKVLKKSGRKTKSSN